MTKTIYSRWLATELRDKGFEIVKVHANPKKPQLDCYDFEDTPEFEAALSEINDNFNLETLHQIAKKY